MATVLSVQERQRLVEQEEQRKLKDWTTWNFTRAETMRADYNKELERQLIHTNRAYYTYHSSEGGVRSRYHKVFEIAALPSSHPFAETLHCHCALVVYNEWVWIEPTEEWTSLSFVHEESDENNNPRVYVGIPDIQCAEIGAKIHRVFENTGWLQYEWIQNPVIQDRFKERRVFEPLSKTNLFCPDETRVYYDPYPHRFVPPRKDDFVLPCFFD